MLAGSRVEQDFRALERAGSEHHGASREVHHLAGVRVDHAYSARPVGDGVDEHFRDQRVRPGGEVAGIARRVEQRRRRMKRRLEIAAPPAAAASAARRSVLVVQHAVGGDAGASGDERAAHLLDRALERHLDAIELGGPLEDAVRYLRQPLVGAGAAEQRVDLVVVRFHIVVRDRPIHIEAVAARRFELHRSVAQCAASPEVGSPAEDARADQRVRRAGRRVLAFVGQPVTREGVGRVGRDLLVLRQRGIVAVRPIEEVVFSDGDRTFARRQPMTPHRRDGHSIVRYSVRTSIIRPASSSSTFTPAIAS